MFGGISCALMGFTWIEPDFVGFYGILLNVLGVDRIESELVGCLLDFIGFHRICQI